MGALKYFERLEPPFLMEMRIHLIMKIRVDLRMKTRTYLRLKIFQST